MHLQVRLRLKETEQQLKELHIKHNETIAAAAAAAATIKVDLAHMAALAASIFPECIEVPTDPQLTVYTVWPGKIRTKDEDFLDKMEKAKVRLIRSQLLIP